MGNNQKNFLFKRSVSEGVDVFSRNQKSIAKNIFITFKFSRKRLSEHVVWVHRKDRKNQSIYKKSYGRRFG